MRKVIILALSVVAAACSVEPVSDGVTVSQYSPSLQAFAKEFRVPEDPCFMWGEVGCPCIHGHCFTGECVGVAYDDDGYIEDYGMCIPEEDEPCEDPQEGEDPHGGPVSDDRPDELRLPTCPAAPTAPQPDSCEQGDDVFYVSTSPEKCECSGMHWHCAEGWESFSDECGCGCFLPE